MAISIDWPSKVISVPQSYLTSLGGGVYSLDSNQLRLDVAALQDDEQGISYLTAFRHNTEVTLSGVTYARVIEFINGYTITFENLSYAVKITGSNNNIADVANVNLVSIRSNNSAGLISVGGGGSASDIWSDTTTYPAGSKGDTVAKTLKLAKFIRNNSV